MEESEVFNPIMADHNRRAGDLACTGTLKWFRRDGSFCYKEPFEEYSVGSMIGVLSLRKLAVTSGHPLLVCLLLASIKSGDQVVTKDTSWKKSTRSWVAAPSSLQPEKVDDAKYAPGRGGTHQDPATRSSVPELTPAEVVRSRVNTEAEDFIWEKAA